MARDSLSRRNRVLASGRRRRTNAARVPAPRLTIEPLEQRELLALTAGDDVFTGIIEDSRDNVLDVLRNDTPNDGAVLTILSVDQSDQGGTVSIDGTRLLYSPAPDFAGEESFSYTVADGIDGPVQANVTLRVDGVNDAPVVKTVPSGLVERFIVSGSGPWEGFGQSVSGVGDFNGDGFDDVIAGQSCDVGARPCPGGALVLSGVDGTVLHSFQGETGEDKLGFAVSWAGDVNRDGLPDVVAGAPGWGNFIEGGRLGTATVYSGGSGEVLHVLRGEVPIDEFGYVLSGLGDVNGDGFDDIIVGSPRDDQPWPDSGSARVFSGADGSVLYTIRGERGNSFLGWTVDAAGDVNADGRADFIVEKTVYSGADGSVLYTLSERLVRGAGDVNADGFDDLIEAHSHPQTPDVVRVVSGRDGSVLHTFEDNTETGWFGFSVAAAGDANGDGFNDILIGATGDGYRGNVSLYSGSDGALLSVFHGELPNDVFSKSIASAGDVNGDGLADIVVGGTGNKSALNHPGKVWVFASTRAPKSYSLSTTIRQEASSGRTIDSLFPDLLADPDEGAVIGIAVRGVTGKGVWQFSLDNGQTFSGFGNVDASRALLLRSSDRIRYVPGESESGTVSIDFIGWDQTSGMAGAKADTRSAGGSTAFSRDSTTGFLGDLPTANMLATGINQSHLYNEGDSRVTLDDIAVWNDNPFAQVRATLSLADNTAGTFSADSGHGETFDRATHVWTVTGPIAQVNAALAEVTFLPAAGNDRDTTIDVSIVDLQGRAARLSGTINLDVVRRNGAPVIPPVVSAEVALTLHGSSTNDRLGTAVSGAGDVNGDGIADFIVGAPLADGNGEDSGSATVVSGADGSVLYTFHGDGPFDQFGGSVGAAGDVNADGFDDVIVGAPKDDHNDHNAGSAYVYSGADGSLLFAVHGRFYTEFGTTVSGIGDVNTDGFDDVVVGAPELYEDDYGPPTAHVFTGPAGFELYVLEGVASSNDGFGRSVGGAGDVNGDGFDDVIVGFPGRSVEPGVRIYSGADGSILRILRGDSNRRTSRFGESVASAGDVDGDGLADVIVGAPAESTVYVFSGLDGLELHRFRGTSVMNNEFGAAVGTAGDINGDGFDDLLVGDPEDDFGGENAGSVQIFSGRDGVLLATLHGDSAGDRLGQSVSSVGDVNGDGLLDLIVGVPFDDKTGVDSGTALLFMPTIRPRTFHLPPVQADAPSAAQTVAELFPNLLDDPDGQSLGGIAIQSATGQGDWQISLDGRQTYGRLGTVDSQRSLLLRDTDYIRYMPLAGDSETVELVFVGWDRTSGLVGQKADTNIRGGATAFSVESATARIDVNHVNNPPIANGLSQTHRYTEDDVVVPFDDIVVTDMDDEDVLHVKLALSDVTTGLLTADSGFGESYDHETGIWSISGSAVEVNAALAELMFQPAKNNTRDSEVEISIRDRVAGEAQELRGNIELRVVAVNDAPVIASRVQLTLDHDSSNAFGFGFGGLIRKGGDVNGDGFDDVLVGSAHLFSNVNGSVHVYSGLDLSVLLRIEGGESFGTTASILGDVDGDGLDDFVVGAPGVDGKAWVYSGTNGSVLYTFPDFGRAVGAAGDVNGDGRADILVTNKTGAVQLFSGADGSLVYEVSGSTARFVESISNIGDANGDGVADFVVGDPGSSAAAIISGTDGSVMHELAGDSPEDRFGAALGAAGDFNGDGLADVIVGAPSARNSVGSQTGIVRMFSGADGTILRTFEGESGLDRFGAAVSSAGDFDGDGVLDVLVGEPEADNDGDNGGSIYILSGADGRVLLREDRPGIYPDVIPVGALGTSVDASDLNGDGILDFVAGAPWDDDTIVFLSPQATALPRTQVAAVTGTPIASVLLERFTDVESSSVGGAIRATSGVGTWQFSLDDGETFADIGAVDASRSLLLRPEDRIRYVPAAGESGRVSLELVGWDQTDGTAGAKIDTSIRGGSTAFSIESVTAYLPLAVRNRAPTATNLDQRASYVEGDASVPLGDVVVMDLDVAEELTVTLTLADTATGQLSASSNLGEEYDSATGVWTMMGSVGQVNAALSAVEFLPSAENDRDTAIAIAISDGGENNAATLTGAIVLDVTPINDAPILRTSDIRTIRGSADDAFFGRSVAAAGDVNGDGYPDYIVEGARFTMQGIFGRVVVYSGADHSVLHDLFGATGSLGSTASLADDVNADGASDLFFATGTEVRLISGADGSTLYSVPGRGAVLSVGDVSGDGIVDFISGSGRSLYSGSDGAILESDIHANLGNFTVLAGAGDVNGDGYGDLITGENSIRGTARVVSGADFSLLYSFPEDSPSDFLGTQVSGVGDVNADGVPDVAAVAGGADYVRVYSGADGDMLHDFRGDESLGSFTRVGGGGDVNGDGFADILVSGSHGLETLGIVHVFSGADGSILHTYTGDNPNDGFGAGIVVVGDVNRDGLDDVLVAALSGEPGFARVIMPIGTWRIDLSPLERPTVGRSVAELFPELLSDVDTGALGGIAIRSTSGDGSWQYSIDDGQTFQDIGTVDASQSLLLRDSDRIRYLHEMPTQPGPDATLHFVGWDRSSGKHGSKFDSSVTGGSSAFSNESAVATLSIKTPALPDPVFAAGDANRDFQFDQLDLVLVQAAAKYLTRMPAAWPEGDWNGDGVFDQRDIVAALQTGNYLQGRYAARSAIADVPRPTVFASQVLLDRFEWPNTVGRGATSTLELIDQALVAIFAQS